MKRLDVLVAQRYAISRSFALQLIKSGKVFIDGTIAQSPAKRLLDEEREHIQVRPEDLYQEELPDHIMPEHMEFEVLYEDEHVFVIDKPAGVSVHTSAAEHTGTILNGLVERYSNAGGLYRGGIVHRLDKDTSGVLIIAKDRKTQEFLSAQFKERIVNKEYLAFVSGDIFQEITIDKAIARNKKDRKKMGIYPEGRASQTTILPLSRFMRDREHRYTMVQARPKTGRTHQIRIHLKSIGHPIVGDRLYHGESYEHLLLHAQRLHIDIPQKGRQTFEAPIPQYFDTFRSLLNILS